MENLYTPDCIRTSTGIYMNVFEPTAEMISIEDIAHSLSHQCRFGGHLPEFYSVAQHSIMCSLMIDHEHKLAALLHDASEAYLMDIPTPIKKRLSNYKEIEDNLMRVIADKYGFEYPLSPKVKSIDTDMLEYEWEALMLKKPVVGKVVCYTANDAKEMFIKTFFKLTAKRKYNVCDIIKN